MFFFERKKGRVTPNIPDREKYSVFKTGAEVFQPWHSDVDLVELHKRMKDFGCDTLVSAERQHVIKWAFQQTLDLSGEIWEAGVYQGGTARLLASLAAKEATPSKIRLFDSFEGLPKTSEGIDTHHQGDFSNTEATSVKAFVGFDAIVKFHTGWIPDTFLGLEQSTIRLAHVDLDLYKPILDSLGFIYPRLVRGGVIIFDDYGIISCPGARKAVDEFFVGKQETILILPSCQALVIKK